MAVEVDPYDWFPPELKLLEAEYERTKLQIRQDTLICKQFSLKLDALLSRDIARREKERRAHLEKQNEYLKRQNENLRKNLKEIETEDAELRKTTNRDKRIWKRRQDHPEGEIHSFQAEDNRGKASSSQVAQKYFGKEQNNEDADPCVCTKEVIKQTKDVGVSPVFVGDNEIVHRRIKGSSPKDKTVTNIGISPTLLDAKNKGISEKCIAEEVSLVKARGNQESKRSKQGRRRGKQKVPKYFAPRRRRPRNKRAPGSSNELPKIKTDEEKQEKVEDIGQQKADNPVNVFQESQQPSEYQELHTTEEITGSESSSKNLKSRGQKRNKGVGAKIDYQETRRNRESTKKDIACKVLCIGSEGVRGEATIEVKAQNKTQIRKGLEKKKLIEFDNDEVKDKAVNIRGQRKQDATNDAINKKQEKHSINGDADAKRVLGTNTWDGNCEEAVKEGKRRNKKGNLYEVNEKKGSQNEKEDKKKEWKYEGDGVEVMKERKRRNEEGKQADISERGRMQNENADEQKELESRRDGVEVMKGRKRRNEEGKQDEVSERGRMQNENADEQKELKSIGDGVAVVKGRKRRNEEGKQDEVSERERMENKNADKQKELKSKGSEKKETGILNIDHKEKERRKIKIFVDEKEKFGRSTNYEVTSEVENKNIDYSNSKEMKQVDQSDIQTRTKTENYSERDDLVVEIVDIVYGGIGETKTTDDISGGVSGRQELDCDSCDVSNNQSLTTRGRRYERDLNDDAKELLSAYDKSHLEHKQQDGEDKIVKGVNNTMHSFRLSLEESSLALSMRQHSCMSVKEELCKQTSLPSSRKMPRSQEHALEGNKNMFDQELQSQNEACDEAVNYQNLLKIDRLERNGDEEKRGSTGQQADNAELLKIVGSKSQKNVTSWEEILDAGVTKDLSTNCGFTEKFVPRDCINTKISEKNVCLPEKSDKTVVRENEEEILKLACKKQHGRQNCEQSNHKEIADEEKGLPVHQKEKVEMGREFTGQDRIELPLEKEICRTGSDERKEDKFDVYNNNIEEIPLERKKKNERKCKGEVEMESTENNKITNNDIQKKSTCDMTIVNSKETGKHKKTNEKGTEKTIPVKESRVIRKRRGKNLEMMMDESLEIPTENCDLKKSKPEKRNLRTRKVQCQIPYSDNKIEELASRPTVSDEQQMSISSFKRNLRKRANVPQTLLLKDDASVMKTKQGVDVEKDQGAREIPQANEKTQKEVDALSSKSLVKESFAVPQDTFNETMRIMTNHAKKRRTLFSQRDNSMMQPSIFQTTLNNTRVSLVPQVPSRRKASGIAPSLASFMQSFIAPRIKKNSDEGQ